MVSIVVPVYNVEKYLVRCIESILSQTYTDIELVLVDDGSVDKSAEICDRYGFLDSRVKVYHKKKWRGKLCKKFWNRKVKWKLHCFYRL